MTGEEYVKLVGKYAALIKTDKSRLEDLTGEEIAQGEEDVRQGKVQIRICFDKDIRG